MGVRLSKAEAARLGIKIPGKGGGKGSGKGTRHRLDDESHLAQGAIELVFPVRPRVKQRPRLAVDKNSAKAAFELSMGDADVFAKNVKGNAVTPKQTREFEKKVAEMAAVLMLGKKPLWGPVELFARFVLPGNPELWPISHVDGDLDNYEKSFFDSLNEHVYQDDAIIVRKMTEKLFGDVGDARIELYAVPATNPTSLARYLGFC